MDNLAALWRFVRNDPLGRWMGGAWTAVAWCALTWLSLSVALVLVLLTVAMVALQRRRADLVDPVQTCGADDELAERSRAAGERRLRPDWQHGPVRS